MELLIILLLGLMTRMLFLLGTSSDEYSHLWMIQRRKQYGNLWQDDVENSIIPGFRGYPPVPHFITSLTPERYWAVAGKLLSISYDLISITAVYVLASLLFKDLWRIEPIGPISAPAAVTLLFSTSPILHPVTARLKALGGRTLGNLLSLLYFAIVGYAYLTTNPLLLLLCIPLGWLIVLSSQFALQFVVLSSLLLSILYADIIFIAPIALALLTGALIPKLGTKKLLQRKIDHYIWYIRNYNKGTTATNRNNIKDILLLPYYLFTKPKYFFQLVFRKLTPIIAAYSVPPLVIAAYWLLVSPESIAVFLENDALRFLSFLSLASILIFLLTSIRSFLFLGQAERYFEYGAPAIYILFLYYQVRTGFDPGLLVWLLCFQLAGILLNFLYVVGGSLKERLSPVEGKSFTELIDFLQKQQGLRILSIPTKWNFKIATHLDKTDAKFYYDNISNHAKIDGIRYMEEDHILLHFPITDSKHFAEKYDINTIVARKKTITQAHQNGIEYGFSASKKMFENDDYVVYSN